MQKIVRFNVSNYFGDYLQKDPNLSWHKPGSLSLNKLIRNNFFQNIIAIQPMCHPGFYSAIDF